MYIYISILLSLNLILLFLVKPLISIEQSKLKFDEHHRDNVVDSSFHNRNKDSNRNGDVIQSKITNEFKNFLKNEPSITSPKPKPLIDPKDRLNVYWAEMYNYFALKASSDQKFMVRHAPIPRAGSPWPLPQIFKEYNETFVLVEADLEVKVTMRDGKNCLLIDKNVQRFHKNVFGKLWKKNFHKNAEYKSQLLKGPFYISIHGNCEHMPSLKMNESYSIKVQKSGIYLWADEVWGAIRGLETISQLIFFNENKEFAIKKVHIIDFPRFKHRGVLLDTSRHFLHKKTILENLEAMAQNKLNVFHWHIVDDQSFPFQSKVFPNLTLKGAYNPNTHVYTQDDIKDIIEFARIRGIRVIPEFDTPGHTFSWGLGQPHLLTPCYDYSGRFNGLYGPINPILKKNYKFLRTFFREVMTVFEDDYLHLGGDEVPFDCWYSNPSLQSFIRRNSIRDMRTLLSIYVKQLFGIINEESHIIGKNTKNIVWQEMFENDVKLSKDTIVQVWSGDAYTLERVLRSGLQAIFSTCWYLDYISYGQDWDKYYRCEQLQYRTFPNESLFLGGEVCMWAEYVDNDGIMPRLWPRASAAAERLWSDKQTNDFILAAPRLEMHRCRMIQRGIHVGVASGPGYCDLLDLGADLESEFIHLSLLSKFKNENVAIEQASALNPTTGFHHLLTFLPLILICAIVLSFIFTSHSRNSAGLLNIILSNKVRYRKHAFAICIVCLLIWIFNFMYTS